MNFPRMFHIIKFQSLGDQLDNTFLYWLSLLLCFAHPVPHLCCLGSVFKQTTTCTKALVSGSVFRASKTKTIWLTFTHPLRLLGIITSKKFFLDSHLLSPFLPMFLFSVTYFSIPFANYLQTSLRIVPV